MFDDLRPEFGHLIHEYTTATHRANVMRTAKHRIDSIIRILTRPYLLERPEQRTLLLDLLGHVETTAADPVLLPSQTEVLAEMHAKLWTVVERRGIATRPTPPHP